MCNFCFIEATSFHQLYLNFPCDTDNFPKEVNIFITLKIRMHSCCDSILMFLFFL